MNLRKKILRRFALAYAILWLLTWWVGERVVNHFYDQEFAQAEMLDGVYVYSQRLPYGGSARWEDLSKMKLPDMPWHIRSRGIAIAPFIIIDEIAYARAPLACWGGRRISFWYLFGTYSLNLEKYWES